MATDYVSFGDAHKGHPTRAINVIPAVEAAETCSLRRRCAPGAQKRRALFPFAWAAMEFTDGLLFVSVRNLKFAADIARQNSRCRF